MSGNARLQKEFKDIVANPPVGVTAGLEKDNVNKWIATLAGPAGTPYTGGVFSLGITFPSGYPFKPPVVIFKTPIYHCNINSRGDICLDILKDAWTPALTIEKVLLSISSLLAEPNPNDPLVGEIAHLYKTNKLEHDRIAREYTVKHAC
ncbi:ubiquitin-conjugating enzyme E2 E1 [Yasminevirus sp. GU-2018]|uniref:E2 ubiquitin-conjugating enzyme n=1 Tax=Yasminevirus sp. GU-2018 TaxID=2420051 RepID=A0A5K0U9H6_9VIRU|nr:ubiquitin-conjugating enzyme E2 E1 [Yasminevirus sp. GU-2018]